MATDAEKFIVRVLPSLLRDANVTAAVGEDEHDDDTTAATSNPHVTPPGAVVYPERHEPHEDPLQKPDVDV